jgi:tetrahydromethanopterin S-methyltransferase subunit G
MSEERTRDLLDNRPFEERLFARLDAMEARFEARFRAVDERFDAVDARLDGLDNRVRALEARGLDTKPIWERALAEILNIKDRVENIERKFDVLTLDIMQLRGDQRRLEGLFDAFSSKPA